MKFKKIVRIFEMDLMAIITAIFGGLVVLFSLKENPNIDIQLLTVLALIGFTFTFAIHLFVAHILKTR